MKKLFLICAICAICVVFPKMTLAEKSTKNNFYYAYPTETEVYKGQLDNGTTTTQTVIHVTRATSTLLGAYVHGTIPGGTNITGIFVGSVGDANRYVSLDGGDQDNWHDVYYPWVVASGTPIICTKQNTADYVKCRVMLVPYDNRLLTTVPTEVFGTTTINNLSTGSDVVVEATDLTPVVYGLGVGIMLATFGIVIASFKKYD